jgi:hypothetical protein
MTRKKEVRETHIDKRNDYIHIETEGCIVNIRPGLRESATDRPVTSVQIISDSYGEDDKWRIDRGCKNGWEDSVNIRVVKTGLKP